METLIIFALIGAAVWFFLTGIYKTNVKDPETLRDTELEDAFIELKKKILVTSAYEQEQAYQRLYYRINAVMGQIIERHKHFVLDVEAKGVDTNRFFVRREHHDADGMLYYEYKVPNNLEFRSVQPDVLLYLCFFLYLGGQAKNVGTVESDPQLMLKILDYLIGEREYPAASFFKGLVMKYGTKVYEASKPGEARALFEFAQQKGVGAAAIELQQLGKYAQLDSTKSVHFYL